MKDLKLRLYEYKSIYYAIVNNIHDNPTMLENNYPL